MKIRKVILVAILMGILQNAKCQYILKGSVKDFETKEVLPGATVYYGSGNKSVVTDANGDFSINSEKRNINIQIKYIGYISQKTEVEISKTALRKEFYLKKDSNELDEVVVESKANLQDFNKPLLGVNSLSIKTINKLPTSLGETDILKGLQMLPGVSSVGEAANGLNVRGGTTDQNLILLDDAPIFNPTHMFGLFSAFPSDGISNIQLYKGNIPAKFGGRTASVLDISLKNPSLTKFSMEGGISVVSEKVTLDLPLIKDKLGIMLTGRGSFNDFILPIVSPKFRDMKSNFGDVAGRLFYKINRKNTFSLSNYQSNDFFQTELLGSVDNINASASQYKFSTKNVSAKLNSIIGRKGYLETVLVNSVYKPNILFPEIDSDNKVEINQSVKYNQCKVTYKYSMLNHVMETGLDMVHYSVNPGILDPNQSLSVSPKTSQMEYGVESGFFISDEFNIRSKFQISAGLRYSQFFNLGPGNVRTYKDGMSLEEENVLSVKTYKKNETTSKYGGLEPRFGLKYAVNPNTNFKFGYNLSRQYLQQISNTTTPLPTSRWKLADTHIHPQVSQFITAGISKELENKKYQVGVEIYTRNTKDIIDYKSGAIFFLKDFPETEILQGLNKSYGVELMASKEKGTTTGWVNYTYARSLNKVNSGNSDREMINQGAYYPANYDRPHTFNATIVIGQGKHHDFSFNFTYSTGRPFTSPQGYVQYNKNLFPYYSDRNNQRIPAYHRLDFAWNIYNPKMDPNRKFKGNWAFSIYNLYGQKNAYSIFYRAENRVLNPYKLVIFGSPIPSLSYKFRIN